MYSRHPCPKCVERFNILREGENWTDLNSRLLIEFITTSVFANLTKSREPLNVPLDGKVRCNINSLCQIWKRPSDFEFMVLKFGAEKVEVDTSDPLEIMVMSYVRMVGMFQHNRKACDKLSLKIHARYLSTIDYDEFISYFRVLVNDAIMDLTQTGLIGYHGRVADGRFTAIIEHVGGIRLVGICGSASPEFIENFIKKYRGYTNQISRGHVNSLAYINPANGSVAVWLL